MDCQEFSDQFDVLYNNITSNQAPGLDEYEKSVFLTKAQNEILLAYLDPRSNKVAEGYDGSSRRQIDFSSVTCVEDYPGVEWPEEVPWVPDKALYDPRDNSCSLILPHRILIILNERLVISRNNKEALLTVVPIEYNEYNRLMSKPYKRPLKWQAWRLINTNSGVENAVDIIVGPEDTIKSYSIRYVKRPTPIVLADLDGLTIDGENKKSECKLDPIIHHEILQRAVELAKASYIADNSDTTLGNMLSLGQQSQTSIGQIQTRQ